MSSMDIPAVEKAAVPAKTRSKPLITKLAVGGVALVIIIALAVGLGVGLTRHKGGNHDNDTSSPVARNDSSSADAQATSRASLWKPKAGTTWQIVLNHRIDLSKTLTPDVEAWDMDMADADPADIEKLHGLGKKVICYFSAGSWEDWRSDQGLFTADDKGNVLHGWEHERWVKVSSPNVRSIMSSRIKLAASKGCDAIDPDNVDGFEDNDNGCGLTAQDSIDYMRFLSDEARKYNMSIGLKNAGPIIKDVISYIDFSVNEQCVSFSECETFSPFIKANKPVFNIEYPTDNVDKISNSKAQDICSHKGDSAGSDGFSQIMKNMDLDGGARYCDGKIYHTPLVN